MTGGGFSMFNQLNHRIMKVFVLTEIDLLRVGYSPNTIQLFIDRDKAVKTMKEMYDDEFDKHPDKESLLNTDDIEHAYAYANAGYYRLDLYECELDLRDFILNIQELTVVAEERGVRSKLMNEKVNFSRDDVWILMQKWTENLEQDVESRGGWDKCCRRDSRYDVIDTFVDRKNEELDKPWLNLKRDERAVDTDFIDIVDPKYFGDDKPHSIRVTTQDGVARADGITLDYPKVWSLTDEQISEIDEYTGGRIADSGCITPWDVCVKFAKIVHFGVISTWGDAHDPGLVARINRAWVEEKERFELIIKALYERDIDEITNADCFLFDQWKEWPEYDHGCKTKDWKPYNKRALETMRGKWDFYADNYLDHIADDEDLSSILSFLHR